MSFEAQLSHLEELVAHIAKRPGMFPGRDFGGGASYVAGYLAACRELVPEHGLHLFQGWVTRALGMPDKLTWIAAIEQHQSDEDERLRLLHALMSQYLEALLAHGAAAVLEHAPVPPPEGEPELALRNFLQVLWRGSERDIRPLILDHPDAAVLWSRSEDPAPAEVTASLFDLWAAERFGSRETGDPSRALVSCPAIPGLVSLRLVDGSWKVAPEPFIAALSNQVRRRSGVGD